MRKTIGVVAHVDAGKTTFSEALLFHGGAIRRLGRVDHRDSFLDTDEIEKQRGITVFSDQAGFYYGENQYTLVDTPGHVDFSGEMERTLGVLDYAVLVVSAVEGVQSHTKTLWRLLEGKGIPTFLFINKTDRAGADLTRVFTEIKRQLSGGAVLFSGLGFDEGLIEELAVLDEALMKAYLGAGFCGGLWLCKARELILKRELFPCFSGSALNDEGVEEFLREFDRLTVTNYETREGEPFSGRVYAVRHDNKGNRLCLLKVTSGCLKPKDETNTFDGKQKINELRFYSGSKFRPGKEAPAGTLCAVAGLTAKPGETVGAEPAREVLQARPVLSAKVIYDQAIPAKALLGEFKILEDEEPLLNVSWEEALGQLSIRVMGAVQLEILREMMEKRFQRKVSFGEREVLYQETIRNSVIGCGHFEPLRHYAEVHLKLSPGKRGSGITFQSACPLDALDRNYQNLIKTHVMERTHRGVLIGAALTDVEITLLAGRAHEKHTEGGDFREAVYRAIRQGLMQAESVLLEPWYEFSIQVQDELVGRVLSDIQRLHGSFHPPEQGTGAVRVAGRAPASAFLNYPRDLASFSRGRGSISLGFGGYEPCHDPEAALAAHPYDPTADLEHTPDSVFCSHGAGYPVGWREAKAHMHIKL